MKLKRRRDLRGRSRQLCFAAAAAVAAWSMLAPSSGAATAVGTAPPGANYASVAAAIGVLQHTDARMGLSATSEPVYGSLPDAYSTFSSSAAYARASTYYPGATVLGIGGLISTAGGPGGIPGYPFTAIADNQHPDNAIPAPTPLGGPGMPASAQSGSATAHADSALAAADAVVSSFNAPGTAPSGGRGGVGLVHIGSTEAHTRQAFDAPGNLVSHADSHVSGIDIAGGLHIGAVTTVSTTTVDASGKRRRDDRVTVTSGTFMGTPVAVDGNGVTVAGSGQGKAALDLANATLEQGLRAAGLRIHLVGVNHPPAALNPRGCPAGEADGLEISAQVDAAGVPAAGNVYYTDILLGAACSTATLGPGAPAAGAPPGDAGAAGGGTAGPVPGAVTNPSETAPPTPTATSSGRALAAAPESLGPSPSGGPAPAAGQPTTARRRPGTRGGLEAELGSATVANRLRALYLVLGLVVLGLALGARTLVPARLPGTR